MVKYAIRTEIISIDQETYRLSPLKGKFYADFMELATSIEAKTKEAKKENPGVKEEDLPINLSASDYKLMVDLTTESLLASDPGADRNEVETFSAQNLMLLLPVMMKVNTPMQ